MPKTDPSYISNRKRKIPLKNTIIKYNQGYLKGQVCLISALSMFTRPYSMHSERVFVFVTPPVAIKRFLPDTFPMQAITQQSSYCA